MFQNVMKYSQNSTQLHNNPCSPVLALINAGPVITFIVL